MYFWSSEARKKKKEKKERKKKERKEEKRFINSNLNFQALFSLASSLSFSRALEGASPELESVYYTIENAWECNATKQLLSGTDQAYIMYKYQTNMHTDVNMYLC